MLAESVLLLCFGVGATVLPALPAFRAASARTLTRKIGAQVPPGQRSAVEARTARRARGVGVGLVLGGVAVQAWYLVTGSALPPEYQGWVMVGLAWALGVAGLAVVEIWRPGARREREPRSARASVPRLTDYVPRYLIAMSWVFAAVAATAVLAAVALGRSRWFDAGTVLAGPVPAMGLVLALLAVLTHLAVGRVLDTPQPARDEAELYWQDGVRAVTLSMLHVPLAQVSTLVLFVVARTVDAAASDAARTVGEVGPQWVLAVLVVAHGLGLVMLVAFVLASLVNSWGPDSDRTRFRRRLWADPGGPRHPIAGGA